MSLETFSVFYYGHEVTTENYSIDFNEGGPDLVASIEVGVYSLTQFIAAIESALNTAGTLTYTVTVDRVTRKITISANGNFSLLISSGPTIGVTAFTLMGFTGADLSGDDNYTGNEGSGYEYRPQYILQDHVPPENFKRSVSASVNESASGAVEIVRFGSVRFLQCNIQMITNRKMDNKVIKNNPNGVDDANQFMDYITKISPIEFMPNIQDRSTYNTIQLESTPQSKDGIDYTLKELYDRNLPGIFQTGQLTFRVID